jgi:hypothetical protein
MIVKNDLANLERFLSAVIEHIALVINDADWTDFAGPICPWSEA